MKSHWKILRTENTWYNYFFNQFSSFVGKNIQMHTGNLLRVNFEYSHHTYRHSEWCKEIDKLISLTVVIFSVLSPVTQSYPTLCYSIHWAHQAPLSMGFSRQKHWSGLPFSTPGDLPNPGLELKSPVSPALAADFFLPLMNIKTSCCRCKIYINAFLTF